MKVIGIIVVFLLAYAGFSPIVARELPLYDNESSRAATSPGFGVRRDAQERSIRPGQAQQEARARYAGRMKERTSSMLERFAQRLDQYEKFLAKVETRKQKLVEKGADVTRVTQYLATARTNLAAARSALQATAERGER